MVRERTTRGGMGHHCDSLENILMNSALFISVQRVGRAGEGGREGRGKRGREGRGEESHYLCLLRPEKRLLRVLKYD